MTVYCFYLYDQTISKEEYDLKKDHGYSNIDTSLLYAITNKKKYAKQFMEERNMKKFILIKKDIDKETYTELGNKRRGKILSEYSYIYYPRIKENINEEKTTKILSTYMERSIVESQTDESLLAFSETIDFPNPYKLKDKYLNELRLLEYDSFYKLYISNSLTSEYGISKAVPVDEDYPSYLNIILDELEVFIYNFGKYFK